MLKSIIKLTLNFLKSSFFGRNFIITSSALFATFPVPIKEHDNEPDLNEGSKDPEYHIDCTFVSKQYLADYVEVPRAK